jgi:hypothetical protein
MSQATETPTAETPTKAAELRAAALANDWDLVPIAELVSQLSDRALAVTLVIMKSETVAVRAPGSMKSRLADVPYNGSQEIHGIPQWAWRAVLETEAANRDDFPQVVVLESPETTDRKEPRKETPTPRKAGKKERGRVSSEVTDPDEIKTIWESCQVNGGTLSYSKVAEKFGLKDANGMHVRRVCQKHERSKQ